MPGSSTTEMPDTIPSRFLLERDRRSCHLTEHLYHVYETGSSSTTCGLMDTADVVIICQDNVKLKAHRSVLAAASPYLCEALKGLPIGDVAITVQGYRLVLF